VAFLGTLAAHDFEVQSPSSRRHSEGLEAGLFVVSRAQTELFAHKIEVRSTVGRMGFPFALFSNAAIPALRARGKLSKIVAADLCRRAKDVGDI